MESTEILSIVSSPPAQSEFAAHAVRAVNGHFPNKILRGKPFFSKQHAANRAIGLGLVVDVRKRVRLPPAAIKFEICFRFLALPDPFRPAGNVVVIVVLMNQWRYSAHVRNRQASNADGLYQP